MFSYFSDAVIKMDVNNAVVWLTTNLSDASRAPPVQYKGRVFLSVYGFAECGRIFGVFRAQDTNEYYVHFGTPRWNGICEPNLGVYPGDLDLPALIRQIASRFSQQ